MALHLSTRHQLIATVGEKDATVVVTCRWLQDEVPVKVTVVDPRTDTKNTPTAKIKSLTQAKHQTLKVQSNGSDLPSGTTTEYKTPVDTTTVGEKDATVICRWF